MLVVAHLSDTHLDGGDKSAERALRVASYLRDLAAGIDAVVITGDVADHGASAEYAMARDIFALPCPVLVCPGNHDDKQTFRRELLAESNGHDGPVNQVRQVRDAVFALCDSTVPGRTDGYLSDETLAWLDDVLNENASHPVFVCLHHPPAILHASFVDSLRLREANRLAQVIAPHPHVAAILCGHAHTAAATTFAGRPLLVAPGVVSTLRLPWEGGGPFDDQLRPALAFHILDDDAHVTTHYRSLP